MSLITAWLRLEARRRWRSLAVLALLLAVATTTVLASFAGARRGATSVDRLYARSLPATLAVLPNQPDFDWAKVRALPGVEALAEFPITGFGVAGIPPSDWVAAFPPADDEMLRTIERPYVVEGRIMDPRRVDEVMVTSGFPGHYGKGVGDRITLVLMSPEQAASDTYDLTAEQPAGPRIQATIVGVLKSPWFHDKLTFGPQVVPSVALYRAYPDNFMGPSDYANALIRLRPGADPVAFRADLARVSRRTDIDSWSSWDKLGGPERRVTAFEAASLGAFGLAALAAAMVLIGQSVARYAAATGADLRTLRAVGLTPRQQVIVTASGPVLAALAGATLGVIGALVASNWLPLGAAALAEPEPGFDADWLVLGVGWVAVPLLVLAGSAGAAAVLARRRPEAGRRSMVARGAALLGLPAPIVVGARFALEPGRRHDAVPVRPALLGAVAGVLGVLAAFTFAAGVQDAGDNPVRFGRTHQLEVFGGINGHELAPLDRVADVVTRDPDVRSIDDARIGVLESGPVAVTTFTYAPAKARFPVVLTDGRMPVAANQIVLTPGTAHALRTKIGDRVAFVSGAAPISLTVTGIGFVPVAAHNTYDEGGWITPAAHDALFGHAEYPYKFRVLEIELRPGADADAVAARLRAEAAKAGIADLPLGAAPPLEADVMVRDMQALPVLLSVFLALLAIGAVGHALVTAVRRRRHELAVLRALGMTGRQAQGVALTQAAILAAVGLVFGMPLGIALGRMLWRVAAEGTPVLYVPPTATAALLLAAPVVLSCAGLLAMWPGRQAARLRVGHVLRAE
ncbi:ABC transporter permease [Streptosporangiaceae bacterium NEAU-GS5]|nr:ABC transporter permease [Streptosporangiaceae bacterium NEAU-GS5]